MPANDNGDLVDGMRADLQAVARRVREAFRGVAYAAAELDPLELAREDRDTRGQRNEGGL